MGSEFSTSRPLSASSPRMGFLRGFCIFITSKDSIPVPGRDYALLRRRPQNRRITPQAIFSPAAPAGWLVKSSGMLWITTVLPMSSRMLKRRV